MEMSFAKPIIDEEAMHISKVWAVSFSPTGTSRKIIGTVAGEISGGEHQSLDLTCSAAAERRFKSDELVVVGVPVYAGRVAPLAVKRLKALQGDDSPAVVVVLYGNREYEDALIELKDIAVAASLRPLAAAAFIGEHSFSSSALPIAAGRPDDNDLDIAGVFGRRIVEKLLKLENSGQIQNIEVPGNIPYKKYPGPLPATPEVDLMSCTRCGLCAASCPNGAITLAETPVKDVERCIFCCACIKNCPEHAVYIGAPAVQEKRQWLHENYAARKEPEIYL